MNTSVSGPIFQYSANMFPGTPRKRERETQYEGRREHGFGGGFGSMSTMATTTNNHNNNGNNDHGMLDVGGFHEADMPRKRTRSGFEQVPDAPRKISLNDIPPEILRMIAEHEDVTKKDLKSLRLTHPMLARILAPVLFDTIAFQFSKNGDEMSLDRYTMAATRRLQDLSPQSSHLSYRNINFFPRKLVISIRGGNKKNVNGSPPVSYIGYLKRTQGMTSFMAAFEAMYPRLLDTFCNIRDVSVDVQLGWLRKPHACTMLSTVGKAMFVKNRTLDVSISGVTHTSPAILSCISNVDSLNLKLTDDVATRNLDMGYVKDIFIRSPRISSFAINDVAQFDALMCYFPENARKVTTLKSLTVGSGSSSSAAHHHNTEHPGVYLSELQLKTFPNLEDLRVSSYKPVPPAPSRMFNGKTVWHSLANSPDMKMKSVQVEQVDTSLLAYLSNPQACSNLSNLGITFDLCDSVPVIQTQGNVEKLDYGYQWQHFGSLIYGLVVPNVQSKIKNLTIAHRDIQSILTGKGSVKLDQSAAHLNHLATTLAKFGKNISFPIDRENPYTFSSLEQLHAVVVIGDDVDGSGVFDRFMSAIRESPKLKDVKLTVLIAGEKEGGARRTIQNDVDNYKCWNAKWRKGMKLAVEAVDFKATHSPLVETVHYTFQGQQWRRVD